jgi:signal transduction protein with GAF and PtsI domain
MTGADQPAALAALVAVASRLAVAERLAPTAAEPALRAIADAAAAALHVTAASIALHEPADNTLVFRAAAGPEGEGVIGLAIAAHEGIAGYVFSTGQPLAVADVATDPRFERATAEQTGYVPRSLLAVPLADADGIVGVMEWLDRTDGAPFDLLDMEVARRVAAAATATARATRLEHDAGGLLRRALASTVDGASDADTAAVETLVEQLTADLATHDALWRLADRIGQLRDADPDDLDLAVAWLVALLARTRRRGAGRRRS